MYATQSNTASTIASSSRSAVSFDSRDRASPLYTLDYQVPVHSLEDSVAIMRRAQQNTRKSSSKKSPSSSQASSLRLSLSRFSSRVAAPSLSYNSNSSSRSTSPASSTRKSASRSKTDISHLLMASNYTVPMYDLEDSVKILRTPRDGRQ